MGKSAVLRDFVEIAEGQVHLRASRPGPAEAPVLVMIHASPASSKTLEPLIERLGRSRRVVAPDTLGNGNSCPPAMPVPDICYLADAHLRALDRLGIDRFDLYGTHTGGCIAAEIAIARPQRVRRLVLDGMSLYSDAERADMLAHYAPAVEPDLNGAYLAWAWHFVRDNYLFWPWYRRDAGHVRRIGLPDAAVLHDKLVEVLKAVRSYHLSYRAAIAYDKQGRLPLVRVPTLLACARSDMLLPYFEAVAALLPGAETMLTPGIGSAEAAEETAALFARFLE